MSDIISRQDAIGAICKASCDITPQRCAELTNNRYCLLRKSLKELPSAEPPYQYSEAYVEQIRTERDILQDMVDNMAKPKTEVVLCALADRACPFQGKEYAWCLTCPHISEEDRELVKKAVAEPKTGRWIFNTGEHTLKSFFICSECGGSIFHESNYCPNCGAKMEGGEE